MRSQCVSTGPAGLGFAVVAEEVRSLSLRCADAARQTGDLIEESVRNARREPEAEARRLQSLVGDSQSIAG